MNAMLSLAQAPDRRIWVILDELPTLHQVPSLQPGLAESRQFGGCFVLGVQVASALRDLYGRNGAETISGLCGTRVVLAAPDRDTAQWSADSLGRSEVEEVTEGYSYGANTIRDGVSLTPKRELRALALPSEIMRLENLHGYLKFPGPFPVASIRLRYVARGEAAARFVPREGSGQESGGSGTSAESRWKAPTRPIWSVRRRTPRRCRASSIWPCRRRSGRTHRSAAARRNRRRDRRRPIPGCRHRSPKRDRRAGRGTARIGDRTGSGCGCARGTGEPRTGRRRGRKRQRNRPAMPGRALPHRRRCRRRRPTRRRPPQRAPTGRDMLSIGALVLGRPGRVLLRARRLLRQGRSRAPRRQRLGRQGAPKSSA